MINKIKDISNYIKENNLNVDIEIDGGINYETGKNVLKLVQIFLLQDLFYLSKMT